MPSFARAGHPAGSGEVLPPIGMAASLISVPGSSPEAGIQSVVVALFLLAFGFLLADVLAGRRELDFIVRVGMSLPALAAYACGLMLLHIATGGWLFKTAWAIRGLTLAMAGTLLAVRIRRRAGMGADRSAILAAAVMGVAATALWGTRVFQLLPLTQGGGADILWHTGLATQLMSGELTPSAPVTGDIPNFYPWLYHSAVALISRFTPGGRALHALGPLQLVLTGGMALSLFALGRELTGRWLTGSLATLFGSMAGAFGVLYPGGLSRRPYNVAFLNASPPLPRDLALALLVAFLLLAVAGARRRRPEILVAGGVVLGLAGLAGAEAFFVGMGVAIVLTAFPPEKIPRRIVAGTLILPAVAVYLVWLAPLAVSYLRLGGFVNITRQRPAVLAPLAIVVAWGVSTPLAVFGLVRWMPPARHGPPARIALALLGVTGAVVLVAVLIPSGLGEAFLALGRRHRYWPLLHLAVGLYAAVGGTELLLRAGRLHSAAAGVAAAVIVAVALPSTVRTVFIPPPDRVTPLTKAVRGDPDALLNVVAPSIDGRCVAAVSPQVDVWTFAYSGYRLVLFRWPGYTTNLARIRWRDIYEHIPGDAERIADNAALTRGTTDPVTWQGVVDKYGVDLIVTSARASASEPFDGLAAQTGSTPRGEYVVVRLTPCDG